VAQLGGIGGSVKRMLFISRVVVMAQWERCVGWLSWEDVVDQ
jgi:hypothetical protein